MINPTGNPANNQRKVVAARNTVYGVPFLDQSSRQGGNMHSLVPSTDYENLARIGSR